MISILKRFFARDTTPPAGTSTLPSAYFRTAFSDYILYYCTLKAPGYAVLVNGAWGVGKTHQVRQIIPENERYFVSLYGISDVEGIHDAVLASCLPSIKAGEYISTVSEIGKSMGDVYALAGAANSAWKIFLRQRLKPERTIIFDDLERSSLWADRKSELLGAINHYVEHGDFRVVVLCHEERIFEELAEMKEKTFGHTIQAKPQTDLAFAAFLSNIPEQSSAAFINANQQSVREIWERSGKSSLRVLRQVINDIVRLHQTLAPHHLEKQHGIDRLLRFFCALNIEFRAGTIEPALLMGRMKQWVSEGLQRDADAIRPFREVFSRYEMADLTAPILSDDIINSTIVEGRFDPDIIRAWLDQSVDFSEPSEIPAWLVVIKFDEVDDAPLVDALARMQCQFDDRTVTEIGEFLHICALRFLIAEHEADEPMHAEEEARCCAYIDDWLASGRMPPKPVHGDGLGNRIYEAHSGYAYWVPDGAKAHFKRICDYLSKARDKALAAEFPTYVTEILRQLKEDQSLIIQSLSHTGGHTAAYANIPILIHIPVTTFIEAWLSGSRSGWRQTSMALENRYAQGHLEQQLALERPWLINLKAEFDKRIEDATGLDALRLSRLRPDIFESI